MAGYATTSYAISARYITSLPSDLNFRCGRQAVVSLYFNLIYYYFKLFLKCLWGQRCQTSVSLSCFSDLLSMFSTL